jgi:hypothetical protein
VVEYVVNIHTEIDELALHELDVFARGDIQAPTSYTGYRVWVEVASNAGLGMLEDDLAWVAGKSERIETVSAGVLKSGSNMVALRIIHLSVYTSEVTAGASAGFPSYISPFRVE